MKKLFLILAILLLVPTIAYAASSRKYPKAYCTRTYAAAGADYNDLATWEAATDVNLTALTTVDVESASGQKVLSIASTTPLGTAFQAGDILVIDEGNADEEFCVVDSVNAGVSVTCIANLVNTHVVGHTISSGVVLEVEKGSYADSVQMAGATTSADYYRVVTGSEYGAPFGIPKSDGTVSELHTAAVGYVVRIDENYSQAWDLTGKISTNNASYNYCFHATGNEVKFIGCLAYDCTNPGAGEANGFIGIAGAGESVYFINCLANNNDYSGFRSYTSDNFFYNCTSTNNTKHGFYQNSGTATAKNCASSSNVDADWNGTWSKTTCTAEGATPVYVAAGSDDFHLDDTDTVCKGNGTDLSSDATFPFDDDVDGQHRRVDYDIGFDTVDREADIPTFPTIVNTGTNYYVDKDCGTPGTGTADECDGGADDQLATIQGGINTMSAGDTLTVHEGATAYAEEIDITKIGSSSEWTIIQGATGERPEISNGDDTHLIQIEGNSAYVCLKNFDITHTAGNDQAIQILTGSSNIVLDDLDVDGSTYAISINNSINAAGASDVYLRNIKAYGASFAIVQLYANSSGITFDQCEIHGSTGGGGIGSHSAYGGGAVEPWSSIGPPRNDDDTLSDIYIIDSTVHSNNASGIDLVNRGDTVIKNTKIYGNGSSGIKALGTEVWITNNLIYKNDSAGAGADGVWIKPFWRYSRYYLRGNTIVNNGGTGTKHELRIIYKGGDDYYIKTPLIYMYNNLIVSDGAMCVCIDGPNCLHDDRCFIEADNNFYCQPGDNTWGLVEYDGAWGSEHIFNIDDMSDGTWYAASGVDEHAVSSIAALSTLFTDATTDDFTLVSGSPAIGVGKDLGSDYDDALHPDSTWPDNVMTLDQDYYGWSIGAYGFIIGLGVDFRGMNIEGVRSD